VSDPAGARSARARLGGRGIQGAMRKSRRRLPAPSDRGTSRVVRDRIDAARRPAARDGRTPSEPSAGALDRFASDLLARLLPACGV
jgi:hypothetical protein